MARRIFGKINVEGGISPGTKMKVIAWDADVDDDDRMGTAEVADDGSYSIDYEEVNWDWSPGRLGSGWRPDIYVVVEWFDERRGEWLEVARSKVYSDQDVREDKEIDLSVTLPHTNTTTIYGWVTDGDGRPLEGFSVTAWDEKGGAPEDRGTGIEELLGSAVTDDQGHYRIRYAASRFEMTLDRLMREGIEAYRRPDIFIKVQKGSEDRIIYRSPTIQNVLNITGCRIDGKISANI